MFEDIELEIEQNLGELKVLYTRIQHLNGELGNLVLKTDFLKAVKQLKIDSYFKFVGPEQVVDLTGTQTQNHITSKTPEVYISADVIKQIQMESGKLKIIHRNIIICE